MLYIVYAYIIHVYENYTLWFFQIKRLTIELYDGKGEPPSWKLILQASSTGDAIANLNKTVTLAETKLLLSKKWTVPITRVVEKPTLATASWVRSSGQFNNYYRRCNIEIGS